ncbi:acyl-CoA dehydrogenase/oxidase [Zopfochytrium polystomum]|nr:acyl-CoA dehydrogenase/oxidase [Zopfochytrium polystomum]
MPSLTTEEVAKHTKESDVWIIVHGKVYDVTTFLNEHPGGKKILLKVAGQDASKQFDQFHNKAVLDKFGPKLLKGELAGAETSSSSDEAPLVGIADGDGFGDLVPFGDPYWYQDGTSPFYDESHRRLRSYIRNFTEKHVTPNCFEWDEKKMIPHDIFKKAAEAGILAGICGGSWPTKYVSKPPPVGIKPEEFSPFHMFVIMDELSRCGSGGVLWGICGGLGIGLPPVIHFGSEELKARVVPQCLTGEKRICLAITEPYAGSDVANLRTEAKKTPDGKHYIINGEKKWITNGIFADYFTVACRTGGAGMNGLSLILVERTRPGVTTRQMDCSGVWASGTTYITFEDVKVPVENIIGKENKGFKAIMFNFNNERFGIAIQATRFARVCYEDAMKYAHKRKTFGKKLVDHPVIRNKFAHMARKIEATHAWMEQLLFLASRMDPDLAMLKLGGPIALLKAQSTQTLEFCAREACQIFGGLSYTRGGQAERVERLYREVRAYAIPGGSEEIMLDLGIRQSLKVAQFMGAKL